jgi:hypothetical protein
MEGAVYCTGGVFGGMDNGPRRPCGVVGYYAYLHFQYADKNTSPVWGAGAVLTVTGTANTGFPGSIGAAHIEAIVLHLCHSHGPLFAVQRLPVANPAIFEALVEFCDTSAAISAIDRFRDVLVDVRVTCLPFD